MNMLARFKWPLLLALASAAMMIPVVLVLISLFHDTGTRFFVPGEISFNVTKSGDYTLWHEAKGMIHGQFVSFSDDLPPGTTINVVKQPEGTPVALVRKGSSHMDKNGTRRVAAGQLKFREPGQYRVTVTGLPETRAFYLDESKFAKVFLTVIICGFLAMSFFFAAIGTGSYALVQLIHTRRNPTSVPPVVHGGKEVKDL